MAFPETRLRRLRRTETLRRMMREISLSENDLIYPMFVVPGKKVQREINSMPGNYHWSADLIVKEAARVRALGVPAVLLFGHPVDKDASGTGAYDDAGAVQEAVRAIKQDLGDDIVVITDVCLCAYTDHGHCGIVRESEVDNDETLQVLAGTALSHARAGADMVAPSDMMDGRVAVIRDALDEDGFSMTPIMSYAAKYASAFYGPFRDAADSTPQSGDRRGYQMDPGNADEALHEVELDIEEGADIVMVKPALPYLDIVRRVKAEFGGPVAAYQVSGEFAMLVAAAERGWLDRDRAVMEALLGIKRAGADLILTYFAPDVAAQLAAV